MCLNIGSLNMGGIVIYAVMMYGIVFVYLLRLIFILKE
jgi:hypothetical protein